MVVEVPPLTYGVGAEWADGGPNPHAAYSLP